MVIINFIFIFCSQSIFASIATVDDIFDNMIFSYKAEMARFTSSMYIFTQSNQSYKLFATSVGKIKLKTKFSKHNAEIRYRCKGLQKRLSITGVEVKNKSLLSFYDNLVFSDSVQINFTSSNQDVEISYNKGQFLKVKKHLNHSDVFEYILLQKDNSLRYKKLINYEIKYNLIKSCTDNCRYQVFPEQDNLIDVFLNHQKQFEHYLYMLITDMLTEFTHCS